MEYYFSITGVPERIHVMGMNKHFDTVHFPEVEPYKTYSYLEFRKEIILIFKTPDLTHVNIKDLMCAHQKKEETVLEYKGRVQDNVPKAVPKFAEANRQNLAVSMFCQGVSDDDVTRITALQAKSDVASALLIAPSATAFRKEQHYSQR